MSRQLYLNFIKDNRWKYIVNGLGTTLQITFFAVILGIALGFLIAVIRSTYDKTGKGKILNFLAKVYLTVIRGTPVLVQLLIITLSYLQAWISIKSSLQSWHSVSTPVRTWQRS